MGNIDVKLKDSYENKFITTMAGDIIRHVEYTTVDETNLEIRQLLQDGTVEVQGSETMQKKIQLPPKAEEVRTPPVLTDVPNTKESIREVVTPEKLKENKEVLDKKLAESKPSEALPDEPAPESGDTF